MENNFEKQVQQKMDELSLTPSAPVWEGVQKAIRKKRRRRTLLFWLLPLCLLGGGLGYLLLQPNTPDNSISLQQKPAAEQVQKTSVPGNIPAATPEKNPATPANISAAEMKDVNPPAQQEPSEMATIARANHPKISRNKDVYAPSPVKATSRNNGSRTGVQITESEASESYLQEPDQPVRNIQLKQPFVPLQHILETMSPNHFIRKQPDSIVRTANLYFDTALRKIDAAIVSTETKAPTANQVVALQMVQSAKQAFKKWHWSVDTRIGTSNATTVSMGLDKSAAFDSRSPVANAGAPLPTPPSQPSGALAFSAGVQAKRSLNNAIELTAGVQYSYYSSQMQVGTPRRDTAIGNQASFMMVVADYYRNDNQQTKHLNHFHFIELPVGIAYRPIKNIPLQLQHGVSVGRLLHTNNLQYDGSANIYYESGETVRKTQWNLFTAAEFRLLQNKKFTVHAGPQVQYGLRNFYMDASSKKLLFAGLKAGIEF